MNKKKIVVIDYGIGNVRSICNALIYINEHPILTADTKTILEADKLILPGVGAFSKGIENLKNANLVNVIMDYVSSRKPILGICLGMQLLFEESEEFGLSKGLGLIKGKVVKIPINKSKFMKLPHVSWNQITPLSCVHWESTILHEIPLQSKVYFVHSYVAVPDDNSNILAITNYKGIDLCAAVKFKNIYGTQFHPEKSGPVGLRILKNFIDLKQQ